MGWGRDGRCGKGGKDWRAARDINSTRLCSAIPFHLCSGFSCDDHLVIVMCLAGAALPKDGGVVGYERGAQSLLSQPTPYTRDFPQRRTACGIG